MQINAYLTFNGNCRAAMVFYQQCLGGELLLQTIGSAPLSEKMPEAMKNLILQATLRNNNLVLMGTDMPPRAGLIKGNAVSMTLQCNSEKELVDCYKKLAKGGVAEHPVQTTYWGAHFGTLTDKFGNHWLLNYDTPTQKSNSIPNE